MVNIIVSIFREIDCVINSIGYNFRIVFYGTLYITYSLNLIVKVIYRYNFYLAEQLDFLFYQLVFYWLCYIWFLSLENAIRNDTIPFLKWVVKGEWQ